MNLKNRFLNLVYKFRQISYARSVFNWVAGVSVNPDSAMQVSAFYRGVNYIASSIANLPVEIKDRDKNILDKDPMAYLLNVSPNPEMNAHTFKLLSIFTAIIHGNFYAEIQRNIFGRPVALWPICEYDIRPYRDADGKFFYRVMGGSTIAYGQDSYLDPKDVFHIKNIFTKDGFTGQGVAAYAKDTLGISLNADRMAGNLFANMGMPSGILSFVGSLSAEAGKRVKEQWDSAHGKNKVGGTAVLEQGATFTALNLTPDVLQFLESRKFNVLEISRFLSVSPVKLYDPDFAKFNNIEHANIEVATDILNTWARIYEAEADMKLMNGQFGGKYVELDLASLTRGDMDKRSQYFDRMFKNGVLSSNEIRRAEGKAAYKGGDRYYVQTNNLTPVDRVDEVIESQIAPKSLPAPANDPATKNKDTTPTKVTNELEDAVNKAAADFLISKTKK